MRSVAAFLVVLSVVLASSASAGNLEIKKFVLYGGSNTDSTEQISPWIPVRGAQRVILKFWSAKAAFHASTDADSTYSDSIAVFKVGFTDSVSSTNPLIAGDSVVVTTATVANIDTTTKMVAVMHPPLQEALRGPGNGSGIITWVVPVTPGLATADNNGFIAPQYMRIYVTPLRRSTVGGFLMTSGKRVVGLKGFRGEALVIYGNK